MAASDTLLKNENNLLPLDKTKIKSIAVIGPDAYPAQVVGGGSAGVRPFTAVSYLEGLTAYLGNGATVYYERGLPSLGEMADATAFATDPAGKDAGLNAEFGGGVGRESRTKRIGIRRVVDTWHKRAEALTLHPRRGARGIDAGYARLSAPCAVQPRWDRHTGTRRPPCPATGRLEQARRPGRTRTRWKARSADCGPSAGIAK